MEENEIKRDNAVIVDEFAEIDELIEQYVELLVFKQACMEYFKGGQNGNI